MKILKKVGYVYILSDLPLSTLCYWCFLDKGFQYELSLSNGCQDILMVPPGVENIAILHIHNFDYRCIIFVEVTQLIQ